MDWQIKNYLSSKTDWFFPLLWYPLAHRTWYWFYKEYSILVLTFQQAKHFKEKKLPSNFVPFFYLNGLGFSIHLNFSSWSPLIPTLFSSGCELKKSGFLHLAMPVPCVPYIVQTNCKFLKKGKISGILLLSWIKQWTIGLSSNILRTFNHKS